MEKRPDCRKFGETNVLQGFTRRWKWLQGDICPSSEARQTCQKDCPGFFWYLVSSSCLWRAKLRSGVKLCFWANFWISILYGRSCCSSWKWHTFVKLWRMLDSRCGASCFFDPMHSDVRNCWFWTYSSLDVDFAALKFQWVRECSEMHFRDWKSLVIHHTIVRNKFLQYDLCFQGCNALIKNVGLVLSNSVALVLLLLHVSKYFLQ